MVENLIQKVNDLMPILNVGRLSDGLYRLMIKGKGFRKMKKIVIAE